VTVQAAPAPVVTAPPQTQRANNPPAADPTPTRPAGPTPEEIRAKAEAALRVAPGEMMTAIVNRNVDRATRLFGDAAGVADAADLLKNLKDFRNPIVVVDAAGTPQVSDRTAMLDYRLKVT